MRCNKRLGQGAVEAFNLGIHLWRARIGMEVDDVIVVAVCLKMIRELTAVVGLHMRERYRRH